MKRARSEIRNRMASAMSCGTAAVFERLMVEQELLVGFELIGPHLLLERGRDGARAHRIDADAKFAELPRHRTGEPEKGALGGDVGREVGPAAVQRHRADVDDLTPAFALHRGHDRLGQGHSRGRVDRLDPLVLLKRVAVDRLQRIDRGVVDQDVDAADLVVELADEPLRSLGVDEIAVDEADLRRLRGKPGIDRFGSSTALDVEHENGGARPRERFALRHAEPASRSSDERVLAAKLHRCFSRLAPCVRRSDRSAPRCWCRSS